MESIKNLRHDIITLFLGMLLSTTGFVIKDYFADENRQQESIFKIQKELYDDWSETEKHVRKKLSKAHHDLSTNIGQTPIEQAEALSELADTLNVNYTDFLNKLDRYGNKEQVNAAEELRALLYNLLIDFNTGYDYALKIQKVAKAQLRITNRNDEEYNLISAKLDELIEALIRHENFSYQSMTGYKIPIIIIYVSRLNELFREAIKLPKVNHFGDLNMKLQTLQNELDNLEHDTSGYPFFFAERRIKNYQFASKMGLPPKVTKNNVKIESDEEKEQLMIRNIFIKNKVHKNFMDSVSEQDEY